MNSSKATGFQYLLVAVALTFWITSSGLAYSS